MNILIGLIPALFWGILPLCVSKIGGKPTQQIMGTTMGVLLMGIATSLLFFPIRLDAWAFFSVRPLRSKLGVRADEPISRIYSDRCFSNHAFIDWYAAGRYFADGRGGVR